MTDLILGGSEITTDGDCSHENERCLLLGRKVMTNLDSILKSEDITFRQRSVQSKLCFFPESLAIKKAEDRRIDASELWA